MTKKKSTQKYFTNQSVSNHHIKAKGKENKGFTLIELITALSLISIALVAVISLLVSTLKTSKASKDELIAANLAREGIELIRNIRDTNWLKCNEETTSSACRWGHFATDTEGNLKKINKNNKYILEFNPFNENSIPILRQVQDDDDINISICTIGQNQAYIHSNIDCNADGAEKEETIFSRHITFTQNHADVNSTDEIQVTVTVEWTEQSQDRSISLTEYLYNWQ